MLGLRLARAMLNGPSLMDILQKYLRRTKIAGDRNEVNETDAILYYDLNVCTPLKFIC